MLRATFRTLLAHFGRLGLSAVAVVLGTAFVTGSFILTDSLDRTFTAIIEGAAQDIRVSPAPAVGEARPDGGPVRGLTIGEDEVAQIRQTAGVAAAAGAILGTGAYLIDRDGDLIGAAGPPALAVNWQGDPALSAAEVVSGRAPMAVGEIAVDSLTFATLGRALGERTLVITPQGPTNVELVGEFRFGDSAGLAGATLTAFSDEQAQSLFAAPGRWNTVDVALQPDADPDTVAGRIAAELGDGYQVVTREQQVTARTEALQEGLSFVTYVVGGFAAVSLLVAAFLIYNTFGMLVAQRGRELALLRAIGATRAQVLGSILAEALAVGLLAAVLGVLGGLALAWGLSALFAAVGLELTAGIQLTGGVVLLALVIGVGVTVAASLLPAYRGSHVAPVAAIRDTAAPRQRLGRIRIVLSVAVALAGLLVVQRSLELVDEAARVRGSALGLLLLIIAGLGLLPALGVGLVRLFTPLTGLLAGTAGRLAARNAARAPARLATTAGALLVGVALVVSATVVAASARASLDELVDSTYGAEFVVSSLTGRSFDGTVAERLRAVDGVAEVVSVGGDRIELDGQEVRAVAVGGGDLSSVYAVPVVAGELADLEPGELVIDATTAAERGWEVGDTVTATLPNGERAPVMIVGIFEGNELLQGAIMSLAQLRGSGGSDLTRSVLVTVAGGASPDEVADGLRAAVSADPLLRVLDQTALKEQNGDQLNQLLIIIYALLALSVIIAVLGVLNTLVLAVLERTREIGLLRAIGATQRQIRRMIRWEAVLIALLGTALGLVLGLLGGLILQQALAESGIRSLAIPLPTLLVVLACSVLVGVLAAVLPARRAARLNVIATIATD